MALWLSQSRVSPKAFDRLPSYAEREHIATTTIRRREGTLRSLTPCGQVARPGRRHHVPSTADRRSQRLRVLGQRGPLAHVNETKKRFAEDARDRKEPRVAPRRAPTTRNRNRRANKYANMAAWTVCKQTWMDEW
ncbi:hypothetical protein HPB47_018327 [Ixodes persulcatus]|uniref:Uncharacterized protein n=1 Tax=Ixodes persulcatus TaxID=34615 RepID=A0AC60QMZ4_IXOPE|nr:hypothetical protein HPB47_018327 [Ixodes persulcatus]